MPLISFLLNQECVIYPWIKEVNGRDVYGEPETRKCRIHHKDNLRNTNVNANGTVDQIVAQTKLFTTGEKIPTRSKVECDGETYIVTDCYIARSFSPDHLEVMLQ